MERGEVDDRHDLVPLHQHVVRAEIAVHELLRLPLERTGRVLEHGVQRGQVEEWRQRPEQVVGPRHPREDRVPFSQPGRNGHSSQRRVERAEVAEKVMRLSRHGDPPRQQLLHRMPGRRDIDAVRSRQLPGLADSPTVQRTFHDRVELNVSHVPRPLHHERATRCPQHKDRSKRRGVNHRAERELAGDGDQPAVNHPLRVASAYRSCRRLRISSGEYARRLRSSRAINTPVAATPTRPARPTHFHQRMSLG